MSKLYKTYQQQTWNNFVENDLYNKFIKIGSMIKDTSDMLIIYNINNKSKISTMEILSLNI